MTSSKEYPNCRVDWFWWIGDGICDGGVYNTEECGWDGGDCLIERYPDCHVYNPYRIGDGKCNGGAYNTEECGFDGGDCIEFNAKYPNCTVDRPSYIGEGICNGGAYNTEECGWDGGDCIYFNKYPNCKVDYSYWIGDGKCNGGAYNTEECDWDGGDCIEFNEKYPNCTVDRPSYIGEGICNGGAYNTEECGWDGGDCIYFNKYPNCKVDYSYWIGDGKCIGGAYNTEECGFDGGDCIEFNEKYPNCTVDRPSYIGDGICDGGAYNTEECGWDGGDCTEFNEKYPKCKVAKPSLIGNGECNYYGRYNTKECNWDGGDCPVDRTKMIGIILGGVAFVLLFLVLWYKCFRRAGNLPVREYNGQVDRIFPVIHYVNPNPENEPVDRKTLILASIIHKKVVSSRNQEDGTSTNEESEATILPHEAIFTERSVKIQSLRIECQEDDNKNHDEEAQQINFDLKDDIMVETLRSIRSSINSILTDQHIQDSLYNPKVCPICCEEYIEGDDIACSKNEQCCHAYHTDCILLWLMEHSDCPMCRNEYLCLRDISSC